MSTSASTRPPGSSSVAGQRASAGGRRGRAIVVRIGVAKPEPSIEAPRTVVGGIDLQVAGGRAEPARVIEKMPAQPFREAAAARLDEREDVVKPGERPFHRDLPAANDGPVP